MTSSNTYTTTDLVNSVRLISHLPTGDNTFTPTDIINLADRELQTSIISQIQATRGGYYLAYQDYDAASDGLYVIPSDCVAGTIENIEIVQDTGITPVSLIEPSEQFSTTTPSSTSYGAFMRGNFIQLLPIPSYGKTRIWYLKRPSKLIPVSLAGQITGISDAVVTVTSLPTSMVVGSSIDALGDQPPFNILGTDTIVDLVGTDITLSAPIPELAAGDWIALTDQTPVPQIPVEFRTLLEQRVVVKIYELQGFAEKMKIAQGKLQELEKHIFSLITPRIKSKTKVVSASYGGFLGGGRYRGGNFPAV